MASAPNGENGKCVIKDLRGGQVQVDFEGCAEFSARRSGSRETFVITQTRNDEGLNK